VFICSNIAILSTAVVGELVYVRNKGLGNEGLTTPPDKDQKK
jgi:hypothetical protein